MEISVVLVAAGRGARLAAGLPKAIATVAGITLLELSLMRIAKFAPAQVIVVAPADRISEFERICNKFMVNVEVIAGGSTRQQSVASGLSLVTHENVLVHDAARAFAPETVFERVALALADAESVVPVTHIPDTVKRTSGGWVTETIDRSELRLSQTPQGFRVATLRDALSKTEGDFTDEAALLESFGVKTKTVLGDELCFKITTPADLDRARSTFANVRSGVGVDAHAFGEVGELSLGLVKFPELPELAGHSDGDSVSHAIVDALLSAAALGDIGSNFGTSRNEYLGASGEVFLKETIKLLEAANFEPVNVSVQIVADKPRLAERRHELEAALSAVIGASVSVLATTTDGLGFLADARGIAAVATALIRVRD